MSVPVAGGDAGPGDEADGGDDEVPAGALSLPDVVRRRIDGTAPSDPWGLDADLVGLVAGLVRLRFTVDVQRAERLPRDGPAVVVHNRRFGLTEATVVAEALAQATGRLLRPTGVVDVAPLGSLLRHLGAVAADPAEVRGLLAAGAVVGVALGRGLGRRRAGPLAPEDLAPAVEGGVAVIPVAVIGREPGRRRRVLVGEPLAIPAGGGPLAAVEAAEDARASVQAMLDEGGPPTWVPSPGRFGG